MSRNSVCICVCVCFGVSLFDVFCQKFRPAAAAAEEKLIFGAVCLQAGAGGDGGQR